VSSGEIAMNCSWPMPNGKIKRHGRAEDWPAETAESERPSVHSSDRSWRAAGTCLKSIRTNKQHGDQQRRDESCDDRNADRCDSARC